MTPMIRMFQNLSILLKLCIPVTVLALTSLALVWVASANILTLKQITQTIVDVNSARAVVAAQLSASIDEATIQEKNIILESRAEEIQRAHELHTEAGKIALMNADRLLAMADTPQRVRLNQDIKDKLMVFLDASAKAVALAQRGEKAAAAKLSDDEVRAARRTIIRISNERVQANGKELAASRQSAVERADAAVQTLVAAVLAGLAFSLVIVVAVAVYSVSRPMQAIAAKMEALAGGNLDIAVEGAARKDEVGSLARSLQVFKDNAVTVRNLAADQEAESAAKVRRASLVDDLTRRFEANVSTLTSGLAGAARQMETVAGSMSGTASETMRQTMAVAGAAEQTSANVQTVAAATEEMSASVQEIVQQVSRSAQIANQAVARAQQTDATVQRLAATADRISTVVSVISGIASQTNLLALNATIEAARAGEAGRGFAVVATEVKELASQTATATAEISERIAEIQAATQGAVADIQQIGSVIGEMSSYANSIAAAMEEQGATTQEITRNVQEAARGTEQVTTSIANVRSGADQTSGAASQVLSAAQELSRHSGSLTQEVGSFLARVKSA